MRLVCEECGWADERGDRWRALIVPAAVNEDEPDEPGVVAVYCPECAMREFGRIGNLD